SEGEKKRLAIARALITNPNILLIDEFDSNLDDKSMNFLVDKLSSQYSFIMVTHNNMLKNQFNNIDLNAIAIVE
ncbi:ATP-binding cassette domain-containing protein, partial [Vibrio parahaemolyticus]|nr:ATP-binding cassette domain-containing protein [Vibrio parahaemolyticus]